jgi:hypothetical protein
MIKSHLLCQLSYERNENLFLWSGLRHGGCGSGRLLLKTFLNHALTVGVLRADEKVGRNAQQEKQTDQNRSGSAEEIRRSANAQNLRCAAGSESSGKSTALAVLQENNSRE